MAAFLDCGDDSSGTVGTSDGQEVSDLNCVMDMKNVERILE